VDEVGSYIAVVPHSRVYAYETLIPELVNHTSIPFLAQQPRLCLLNWIEWQGLSMTELIPAILAWPGILHPIHDKRSSRKVETSL
jgi:hypothetical protein